MSVPPSTSPRVTDPVLVIVHGRHAAQYPPPPPVPARGRHARPTRRQRFVARLRLVVAR